MRRTNRLIKNSADDHDPVSMLTNLFDVAMVFAVALMVAMVVVVVMLFFEQPKT